VAEIANRQMQLTTKEDQLEASTADLDQFLIHAPCSGTFVAVAKLGRRVAANDVVARIQSYVTPVAVFKIADATLFAKQASVAVTVDGGARRLSCTVAEVHLDTVKVVCPRDAELDDGTKITLELPAVPPRVESLIRANAEGATVEILGAGQSGPAPFTAKLENGKSYTARVTARGFAPMELDLKGGEPTRTAQLVAKPAVIRVNSDPAGAAILVDSQGTGHITPLEIEADAGPGLQQNGAHHAAQGRIRTLDRFVELAKLTEDDTRMVMKIDEKLTVQAQASGGNDTGSPGQRGRAPSGAPAVVRPRRRPCLRR